MNEKLFTIEQVPIADQLIALRNAYLDTLLKMQSGDIVYPATVQDLPAIPLVQDNELFEALVIGGTNWQMGFFSSENEKLIAHNKLQGNLPPLDTANDLADFIIANTPESINTISLNFAYPMQPVLRNNTTPDGIFLLDSGGKGHDLHGLKGTLVGDYVEKRSLAQNRPLHVAVTNDVVAQTSLGDAAVIVGTGYNAGVRLGDHSIANLEAGYFDTAPFYPPELPEIDSMTDYPGEYLYGKGIDGFFMPLAANIRARERVIPNWIEIETTKQLSELAQENSPRGRLAQEILHESAQKVAAQLAAIMEFRQSDTTFIAQGSVVLYAHNYHNTLTQSIKELSQYNAYFTYIPDCDLLGAARIATQS